MRRVRIAKAPTVLVACTALVFGVAGPAWATSKVVLSPYVPFPRTALTSFGDTFARPSHAQVVSARVSVSQAYAVGLTQTGTLPKGTKVTVRLGLFSNAWQHPAKVRVLSYAVIFDGVDVPSYGPTAGPGGHELVVIVNATTGRSVEAFSYR